MKNLMTICLVAAVFIFCSSVQAEDIWVVPDDFLTIQDAIDSSAVDDGDTILVSEGDRPGALVTKAIEIRGDGGAVISDGPRHPSGFIQGFRLLEGSDGATISHLGFTVDFGIMNGAGVNDVTVEQCTFTSPLQGISNWGGSGWSISDNVFNGLRTACGGGVGILIGCHDGGSANENFISDNEIMGEVVTPEDDCGGYAAGGINLMSDRRWGRLGGTISENLIIGNKVSIFTRHVNISVRGIGLDDLALYPDYADELPPTPDLTYNVVRANDLQGVKGQQISLNPGIVDMYNTIIKNNKAVPAAGETHVSPFGPPEE